MPMLTDPFNKTAKHWVAPKKQIWPSHRVLLEAGIGQRHILSHPVYFDSDRAHALMQVLQTQKTRRQSALADWYAAETRFHDLEEEFYYAGFAFPHFPAFAPNVEEELHRPIWILIETHVVGPLSAAHVGQLHREYATLENEIQKLHESTALANKYCLDAKARFAEAKAKREAVRASKIYAIEQAARRQSLAYHPAQHFAQERHAFREARQPYFGDAIPTYVHAQAGRGYASAPSSPLRTRHPPSGGFPSPQMYTGTRSQRIYSRFPNTEPHDQRPAPYLAQPLFTTRRTRYNSF